MDAKATMFAAVSVVPTLKVLRQAAHDATQYQQPYGVGIGGAVAKAREHPRRDQHANGGGHHEGRGDSLRAFLPRLEIGAHGRNGYVHAGGGNDGGNHAYHQRHQRHQRHQQQPAVAIAVAGFQNFGRRGCKQMHERDQPIESK